MKIKSNFMELAGELDKKYFPEVLTHRDRHHSNERAQTVHHAVELFNNGCLTYRKLIKTLGYNCGDNLENIHAIVSKYIKDFEGFKWHQRTIDKIITHVGYSNRGAPMGRPDIDERETKTIDGIVRAKYNGHVFDCAVPMSGDGAYDRGGAYWG